MASSATLTTDAYSLTELPGPKTDIVDHQTKTLLAVLDLDTLVGELRRVGQCTQLAFLAVTGLPDLQIQMLGIGNDVIEVCNKSAVTVGKFKRSSSTIILSLQSAYGYLVTSFEDMAVMTLADIADTAREMAEDAGRLSKEFLKTAEKVNTTQETTIRTKYEEDEKAKKVNANKIELEQLKERQTRAENEATEARQNAEKAIKRAEEKEEEVIKKLEELANTKKKEEDEDFKKIEETKANIGMMRRLFPGKETLEIQFDRTQSTMAFSRLIEEKSKMADTVREEKKKYQEALERKRDVRNEALDALAETTKKLSNLGVEHSEVDAAKIALHHSSIALANLYCAMSRAKAFWEQIEQHCKSQINDKAMQQIEQAMDKYSEEKRQKFYKNPYFTKLAIAYYACWVGLDNVCEEYMGKIKTTRTDLLFCIKEVFPKDQAHAQAKILAEKISLDISNEKSKMLKIRDATDDIDSKDSKAQ